MVHTCNYAFNTQVTPLLLVIELGIFFQKLCYLCLGYVPRSWLVHQLSKWALLLVLRLCYLNMGFSTCLSMFYYLYTWALLLVFKLSYLYLKSIACHWAMLLLLGYLTWTKELLLLVEMGFSGHHPTLCGLINFIHICCQLVLFKSYSQRGTQSSHYEN